MSSGSGSPKDAKNRPQPRPTAGSKQVSVAPGRTESVPTLGSVAVGLAAFALYVALAPPVSGDGDASELTLALATGGAPHPTGYPLYAMIGHAFCVFAHALGATWPYAANAWSALGGGVAVGLFHALASRLAGDAPGFSRRARFLAALAPVSIAAIDPVWTMSTALAEVYSWHVAWVAGLCLLFVTSARAIAARDPRASGVRRAATWGFVCGLGMAHHLTAALYAAPLSVALFVALTRAKRWQPRLALAALAASAAPLSSYAFVALRAAHPARFQWPLLEPGIRGVLHHVTGGNYGQHLGRFAPDTLQRGLLAANVYPLLFPGLVALLFVALGARRAGERVVWWGLLAAATAQTVFTFNYGVKDPAVFFLAPLWTGLLALPRLFAAVSTRRAPRRALATAAALSIAALSVLWLRVAIERRQGFLWVDAHLRRIWSGIPFERGIVLWPSDMYCRLIEYQVFDGQHPGRFVANPNMLTYDAPRREFTRRFGFDPLAGLVLGSRGLVERLPGNVNRLTALPVAVLDAVGMSSTVLEKGAR